jgi:preprotein translocase subunit SecG
MLMHIINYTIRGLILVLGILMLSGVFSSEQWDDTFLKVMGVVFILFGIYRIVLYINQTKKYRYYVEDEDEEDN